MSKNYEVIGILISSIGAYLPCGLVTDCCKEDLQPQVREIFRQTMKFLKLLKSGVAETLCPKVGPSQ